MTEEEARKYREACKLLEKAANYLNIPNDTYATSKRKLLHSVEVDLLRRVVDDRVAKN